MNTIERRQSADDSDDLSLWLKTVTAIIEQYGVEALDRRWRTACAASGNCCYQTTRARLH